MKGTFEPKRYKVTYRAAIYDDQKQRKADHAAPVVRADQGLDDISALRHSLSTRGKHRGDKKTRRAETHSRHRLRVAPKTDLIP